MARVVPAGSFPVLFSTAGEILEGEEDRDVSASFCRSSRASSESNGQGVRSATLLIELRSESDVSEERSDMTTGFGFLGLGAGLLGPAIARAVDLGSFLKSHLAINTFQRKDGPHLHIDSNLITEI